MKKIFIVLVAIAVLVIPFSVFAATSDTPAAKSIRGFLGIDTSKLTDSQKADIKDYAQKMADLQKDFINKMVENGTITKEQGDAELKRIDDMLANGGEYGFFPGLGRGRGVLEKRDGQGVKAIDASKLTDQQKAELTEIYKKMSDAQKEYVGKMVDSGLITKAQGDAATSRIDNLLTKLQENGFSNGMGMMGGFIGFGGFGMGRLDTAELTDQQKTDRTDFTNKMAELEKEFTDKLVSYGLITSEQADSILSRADNPGKFQGKNRFLKGGREGKEEAKTPQTQENTGDSQTSGSVQ